MGNTAITFCYTGNSSATKAWRRCRSIPPAFFCSFEQQFLVDIPFIGGLQESAYSYELITFYGGDVQQPAYFALPSGGIHHIKKMFRNSCFICVERPEECNIADSQKKMVMSIDTFDPVFEKKIYIQSAVGRVWQALTRPGLMMQWMFESEIRIVTSWEPGSAITISGDMHGIVFEDKGRVIAFEEEQLLQYTHLSSFSNLEDKPGNYCLLEFRLTPAGKETVLDLRLSNFPTEAIYRHMAFYWNVATSLLKRFVEQD